jgi:hypothetical protein
MGIITCSSCKEEVGECEDCGTIFEDGDDIICYEGGLHFCDIDCLVQHLNLKYNESQAEGKDNFQKIGRK